MPNYYKFDWQDFRIKTRPIGWRRFVPFYIAPYITGSRPKIKVTIDTISGEQRQLGASLHGSDSRQYGLDILPSSLLSHIRNPANSIAKDIEVMPISVSGDHIITIELRWGEFHYSRYLAAFRAIAQEIMIGWTVMIFLVIGGTVVGILNLINRS